MQGKTAKTVLLLTLMTPISSFSMAEVLFKAGLGVGIFVAFTILVVIAYVINQIVTNKEIKK